MTAVPAPTPGSPEAAAQQVSRLRAEIVQQFGPNTLLWSDQAIVLDVTHAHPGGLAKLLASKDTLLSELYRESATQQRAISKARAIRAKEQELARERGVPGCYLAIGRATWTKRRGPKPNAPVFLRRLELIPESPAQQEFRVVLTGEAEFNPALRGFLESVGGTDIPFDDLVRMSMRPSGFDPAAAYEALGRSWPGPPGWSIARDMWITTFPYAKLPAVSDFTRVAAALEEHPLLDTLVRGAATGPAPGRTHEPADPELVTVLDADPGQIAAIEAVRAGESIVIDSPPGTGKSQTIVCIAADLARSGRSTLVVAAAADSRSAVTGRLVHCGLGSLVREPGTGSAPAAHRPSQFARASQVQSAWTSAGRELSEHVARMHRGREPWSLSVDEIQERIAAVCEAPEPPRSKIRLSGPHLGALGPAEAERWMTTLRGVAERGAWPSGEEPADPWWGAAIRTDEDAERARLAAKALGASGLAQFDAVFTEVFAGVSVPPLRTLGQHGAFIAEMARIGQVLEVFRLGVFDAPLEEWTAHTSGGTFERWRHGRAVKALLRPGAPHHDVDPLLHSALQARPVWQQVRGSQIMPGQVAGLGRAREAYDKLAAHASYLGERLRGHPDLLAERLPQLAARAADLSAQRSRLEVLPAVTDDLDAARTAGLGELIEDLAARRLSPEHVAAETEFVWLASVLAQTTASDSGYARVTGDAVRAAVTRFRENDRALQRAAAAGIIAERGEGKPLICVCSPHTVGLYLSRKAHFDVVIIDDAQALATADGISALARADQAVVVGDSHLPGPTFFTATAGGAAAKGSPSSSLLTEAAAVWPVHRFAWHYRSRDQRLTESPVATAYPELRTFPSPSDTGVVRVEAAPVTEHDHGLVAQAVRAVVTHARLQAKESLAVLTVDPELAQRIRDGIRATTDPSVADFLGEQGGEALVVLDAAHATGVVRDAAIVVLGQQTPDLVAGAAGARLLTAALTRARARQTVLHTLDAAKLADAAGDGPARLGARILADLLANDRPKVTTTSESTLTRDLARRLKSRGLRVREGVAPGMVDLAVRDPFTRGPVALAIQIDGPAYAALGGNRMRDRLVQEQLRRLGWRPLRILTVDLFRDPAREEARIVAAMERMAAGDMRTGPITGKGARRASRPATGRAADGAADQPAATGRPEQTRDDTDAGWGERPASGGDPAHDRWLQENRPPHWE
ncbi:MAG: hypothetical protein KDB28_11450 [Tetrasphaera sp.]|nr:hypothetical protein [Tetrasphaera sp.]